jgi:hypothetical protein
MKKFFFLLLLVCFNNFVFSQEKNSDDASQTKKIQFIDMSKFDKDMSFMLTSDATNVEVGFYEKVSPNKTPERIQNWLTAVEKNGGTINVEPPPNEMVPKSPFALLSLIGSLWSGIKTILETMDNNNQYLTKGRNATIQLERDPKGEIVISRILFTKNNTNTK